MSINVNETGNNTPDKQACVIHASQSIDCSHVNITIKPSKSIATFFAGSFVFLKGLLLAAPLTLLSLIVLLWAKSNTESLSLIYQDTYNAVTNPPTSIIHNETDENVDHKLDQNEIFIDKLRIDLSQNIQSYLEQIFTGCKRMDSRVNLDFVQTKYEITVQCHQEDSIFTTTFRTPGFMASELDKSVRRSFKLSLTSNRIKFYTKDSDKIISTLSLSQPPREQDKLEVLEQVLVWYIQSLLRESNVVTR
ncbi:hypothetical protein AB6D11_00185 [Vibrio splendidus]